MLEHGLNMLRVLVSISNAKKERKKGKRERWREEEREG